MSKGHKARDCPSMKVKCKDCGQYGHKVCTYATRAMNNNVQSELPDHDEEEDGEYENEEEIDKVPATPGPKGMNLLEILENSKASRFKRQERSISSLNESRTRKKVHNEAVNDEGDLEGSGNEENGDGNETGEVRDSWYEDGEHNKHEDDVNNMDEDNHSSTVHLKVPSKQQCM